MAIKQQIRCNAIRTSKEGKSLLLYIAKFSQLEAFLKNGEKVVILSLDFSLRFERFKL